MGVKKQKKFFMQGGLGNQLFIYAAGKHYSFKTGESVAFDYAIHRQGITNHRTYIRDWQLSGIFINSNISFFFKRFFAKIKSQQVFNSSNTYFGAGIGYDSNLEIPINQNQVLGYFQTFRYLNSSTIISDLNKFSENISSDWFSLNLSKIEVAPTVGIHVRLGDYRSLKSTIGCLSGEYYLNALNSLLKSDPERYKQIAVFSDDIEEAKHLLSSTRMSLPWLFIDSSNQSDFENLLLMSKVNALIIPNSTYSWWAAHLGFQPKVVIAPMSWFRHLEDPVALIPKHWWRQESVWDN